MIISVDISAEMLQDFPNNYSWGICVGVLQQTRWSFAEKTNQMTFNLLINRGRNIDLIVDNI